MPELYDATWRLAQYLNDLARLKSEVPGKRQHLAKPGINVPREDAGEPMTGHPEIVSHIPDVAPPEEPLGPATTEYLKATARRCSARTWAALREDGGEAGLPEPGLADLLRTARFRPSPSESLSASRVKRFLCMDLCDRCARTRRDLFWSLLGEVLAGVDIHGLRAEMEGITRQEAKLRSFTEAYSAGPAPGEDAGPVRGGGGGK